MKNFLTPLVHRERTGWAGSTRRRQDIFKQPAYPAAEGDPARGAGSCYFFQAIDHAIALPKNRRTLVLKEV